MSIKLQNSITTNKDGSRRKKKKYPRTTEAASGLFVDQESKGTTTGETAQNIKGMGGVRIQQQLRLKVSTLENWIRQEGEKARS